MKRNFILTGILAVTVCLPVSATIINIPDDYETIQEGIDASTDGDTVLVQPGTYVENINFNGHNIVLGSLFLMTGDYSYVSSTIIDGNSSGTVVTFINGENETAFVEGFTIRNGNFHAGAGIRCIGSNPTIISNLIVNNYALSEGGDARGGGIFCSNSNPSIVNNVISENTAYAWRLYNYGKGAGIFSENSAIDITNNVICGNTTLYGYGGGIYAYDSNIAVSNCILWANIASDGVQIFGDSITVSYCDVHGGAPGEGNIEAAPFFINALNNDYNICSQSPCIDAGDPNILDPDGTTSDIGVYYPDHPECFVGDKWHISPEGNDTTGDGSIQNPFRTIQHGIDISIPGDTILAEIGIYEENLMLYLKEIRLFSSYIYSNNDQDITNTIIDGNAEGSVITVNGCDTLTAIAGFTMRNGLAFNGGGINIQNARLIISNNFIADNATTDAGGYGGGIYCRNADCTIEQNSITGNFAFHWGGGVNCVNSNPLMINNTISHNSGDVGGIRCYNSSPIIKNNIVWGNAEPQMSRYLSDPQVTYCDIEGGWEGEGNIDIDPLFRDPDNGDFHLMSTECGDPYDSPCIDTGSPAIIDSLLDCSWGLGELRGDMGAYGGGDSTTVGINDQEPDVPIRFGLSQNYPNPFNISTVIHYRTTTISDVTIEIYDILGRKVETLIEGEQPAGYNQATWNAESKSSGIYFYRIQAEDFIETRKMMLLK